ncbi:MAG TPA: YceD family protein [Streptosporangiaceae bacterium]|nr:YceD family protein [Streptosporangiaceae bacterium]
MSHAKLKRSRKLDPRGPLVFDLRTLGSASARAEQRVVPAPSDLGAGLVHVPTGADVRLEVQLEDVSEGVLVTAKAVAPLAGECARCLDEFTSSIEVSFQELYVALAEESGEDGYVLDGDLLDLEPALRDALVLELPLSPLCASDCAGLCSICGVRLAEVEPGHAHESDGGVWAVLKSLFPAEGTGRSDAGTSGPEGSAKAGTNGPEGSINVGSNRPEDSKEH